MQRELGVLFLLGAVLGGCTVLRGKNESQIQKLRHVLDYPVHSADFRADGTPSKITFTDLQIAPEIASGRWIAFSSGSLGKDGYEISEQTLANLSQERQLRWLSMTGVEVVSKQGWKQLQLTGIEHLDLAATNVDDNDAIFLRSGKDLVFLDFSGTSIGDASLTHLAHHQKLAHIRLNGTSVSDQGLAALAAMRSLKIIEVIDSQVTEAGALSYRAANGAAEIVLEEAVGGVL